MANKTSKPDETNAPLAGGAGSAAAGEGAASAEEAGRVDGVASDGAADGADGASSKTSGPGTAGPDAAEEPGRQDAAEEAGGPRSRQALPTVTVTAGPAVSDGLELAAATADPASTGAVDAIAPVTPVSIPAQPAPPQGVPDLAAAVQGMPDSTVAPPEAGNGTSSATSAPEHDAVVANGDAPGTHTAPGGAQSGASPRRQREDGPEPAAALTSDRLLNKTAAPPVGGWRLWLYKVSFGSVNVGDSDKVRLERAQDNLISSRLGERTRFVPVLSRKGGVGKTTVTTVLGMVLADTRQDRVIAMDANPDRGTLSDRSPGSADFTARNLVKDRFSVTTFSQLSNYVARDGSRLDVLASDTDPAVAQAFDDSDYRAVTDILGKYYSIVLTDSGTGMVHSVMKGTLEKADAVVLVSGGSVDEARLASETLSWLEAHGRHDLVANATVVVNMSGGETQVDIAEIEEHFKSRVRNVLRIPYDKHLAEGSRVELAKLRPATRLAVKELAALVVAELQRP